MKLIKLNTDHYVIVDDSEIKEGDWIVNINGYWKGIIAQSTGEVMDCWKKITHSTQPLEWFGGEIIFLSEVKELLGDVNMEKKAEESVEDDFFTNISERQKHKNRFIEGYTQALEDNKEKRYTEEDMKVAITQAFLSGVERLEDFERVQEMILDNVKPKTEWEVEFIDGKLTLK